MISRRNFTNIVSHYIGISKSPSMLFAPALIHFLRCLPCFQVLPKLRDGGVHLVKTESSTKSFHKLITEFCLAEMLKDFLLTENLCQGGGNGGRIVLTKLRSAFRDADEEIAAIFVLLGDSQVFP